MKAGELRHQVTLQVLVPTRGSTGQILANTWADVATYRARVTPLFGSEANDGTEVRAVRNHQVKLRAGPAITARHRFKFEGRTLNITAVIETGEANRELQVFAREEVSTS